MVICHLLPNSIRGCVWTLYENVVKYDNLTSCVARTKTSSFILKFTSVAQKKIMDSNFEADFKLLKERLKIIVDADPEQYHNDYALKRFLKAFHTVDGAFQAILKCNKWRREYGINAITAENPIILKNIESKKAMVLRHRDFHGRPVIYIPAKNHNTSERDLEELTRFIVYILEEACKKCFEEVIDNLCIIFDLKDFGLSCMDYQLVKNLIWLLSKHYPERLGVCLILNSPTLFSGCWTIIRQWLNEVTASKVVFVNKMEELMNYIHPDILPEI